MVQQLIIQKKMGQQKKNFLLLNLKLVTKRRNLRKNYDEAKQINSGKAPSKEHKGETKNVSKSKSKEIPVHEAKKDKPSVSSASSSSSFLSSSSSSSNDYEQRTVSAEKLLTQINFRLAEVEQQLGLTSLDEKKSTEPLRFGYWAIRGLAQPIRLLLNYLHVPFTERRYVQADNFSREDWDKEKFTLGLAFPNLPYLFDGDVKLTQSHSIITYISRRYGPHLTGANVVHQAEVEMLLGAAYDFRENLVDLCYSRNFNERIGKYKSEYLPSILKQFSTYLVSKGNVFITGTRLTLADFVLYELFDQNRLLANEVVTKDKNIIDYLTRFESLPAIAEYRKSKDFISRPLNNKTAAFK